MSQVCVVCQERPAEVPDRERMGRPTKRVCRHCHGERLLGDLRRIQQQHEKKLAAARVFARGEETK